jgi:hypothetical protein
MSSTKAMSNEQVKELAGITPRSNAGSDAATETLEKGNVAV